MIRITLTSIMVDDQTKAHRFYTEILGFVTKQDFPVGGPTGGARWLTVASPAEPDGVELLLEPMGIPAAEAYQKALFEAGIPLTAFAVDDIQAEYDRMRKIGVAFHGEPTTGPGPSAAVFEDTCGNLIQIFQA